MIVGATITVADAVVLFLQFFYLLISNLKNHCFFWLRYFILKSIKGKLKVLLLASLDTAYHTLFVMKLYKKKKFSRYMLDESVR